LKAASSLVPIKGSFTACAFPCRFANAHNIHRAHQKQPTVYQKYPTCLMKLQLSTMVSAQPRRGHAAVGAIISDMEPYDITLRFYTEQHIDIQQLPST
jgi:hypothetical protein